MRWIEDIKGIDENKLQSFAASVLEDINPGDKVLVIIPDYTRVDFTDKIAPLIANIFKKKGTRKIDFLNAGGTHRGMEEAEFFSKLGLKEKGRGISFFNHLFNRPGNLAGIGNIPSELVKEKTNNQLNKPIPVTVNKLIFSDYSTIIALSGTVPHEASGYSGGLKIFFPGISGPEVIDLFHWAAVLVGIPDIMGTVDNNARDIINKGSKLILHNLKCSVFSFNMVCTEINRKVIPNGLYADQGYQGFIKAYRAAAALSSKLYIKYIDQPIEQAVQVIPEHFDEIWTAAKGSYKLQKPGVMAKGGEVILYAPHIKYFHSNKRIEEEIKEVGYHCRDRICSILGAGKKISRNSASHLINAAGPGTFDPKTEKEELKFKLTLASGIPEEICKSVGLNYRDPGTIKRSDFLGPGKLWIEEGGKYLYMLDKSKKA
ncbi:MAG: lactate racemase domain-containing protein [Actinomycetota bacterium]